jgi:hypothetical protein
VNAPPATVGPVIEHADALDWLARQESASVAAVKRCPCAEHEGPNPLPLTEFGRKQSTRDGLNSWCKACNNRAARRYKQENQDKVREYGRRHWQDVRDQDQVREKNRERARRWHHTNAEKANRHRRAVRAANLERERGADRRKHDRVRDQVFDHYGRACACCEDTKRLTIDHVDGNGKAHRIELFGRTDANSTEFYRWLIKQGFPLGFQVFCLLCNQSKRTGPACRLDHSATLESA